MNVEFRDFCGAFRTVEEAQRRTKDAGISGRSPHIVFENVDIPDEKTEIYVARRLKPGDLFDYAGIYLDPRQAARACGESDHSMACEV